MTFSQRDIDFFMSMLHVDSTSGSEQELALWLYSRLKELLPCNAELLDVGDGTQNLRVGFGNPRVMMCSHLDTVPPYIAPHYDDTAVYGRGTCDAKGQVFAMIMAAKDLVSQGVTDFGLLFLAGEETGSFGARWYDANCPGCDAVIVGEPTGNSMVKASKGTRLFNISIFGKACHSGYPEWGDNAIDKFSIFYRFCVDRSTPE